MVLLLRKWVKLIALFLLVPSRVSNSLNWQSATV